jgi:hypothetical protein
MRAPPVGPTVNQRPSPLNQSASSENVSVIVFLESAAKEVAGFPGLTLSYSGGSRLP